MRGLCTIPTTLIPVLLLLLTSLAWGETITAKRIASALRFIPLQKITVGPDDQYQGVPDPSGTHLVFTRKSDLVPHICAQNLKTGAVINLLPLSADSEEPAFNPQGVLAFTYYKYRADGNICYGAFRKQEMTDQDITCLKADDGAPSSPFWKSSTELGFILRDTWTQNRKIIVVNLKTGKQEVLAEGHIWSPSMKPDGRYLFYNELKKSELKNAKSATRVLVLKDLQTAQTKTIHFLLPGISGFPVVSADEKTLFFSHYLDDTNHDTIIDGNDNSVVFRVPIERLLSNERIFPEQLTSVESNCSFIRPLQNQLYATCAFEGALDIYQLPISGTVPSNWNEKTLANAHQTSRSYAERILVLNTLKYRSPQSPQVQGDRFNTRILSNHLMAGNTASSKFYIEQLNETTSPQQKSLYALIALYLEARENKDRQNSEEISRSFSLEMKEIENKLHTISRYPNFKMILHGLISSYLNQNQKSLSYLKQVKFSHLTTDYERYFYFELAHTVLLKMRANAELDTVYRELIRASELSEESKIYYTFRFLQELQKDSTEKKNRIQRIESMNKGLSTGPSDLLKSELIVLKLIHAGKPEAKRLVYGDLDQMMSSTQNQFFLRKALSIRAIFNFSEAEEFDYLNFVATNWLKYTQADDTEFSNAREALVFSSLGQAYGRMSEGKMDLAANHFFGSLTLTDDLESHFGYIRTKILSNQRAILTERYKNLKNHQQIEDNLKFVEALLILMDARPSAQETGYLDQAMAKLNAMDQDRHSAVRFLLLGYCFLEKLQRNSIGLEIDSHLFENAHQNLVLAYDQGQRNYRIRASALWNLGILHQRAQNHGLAVRFFTQLKALGFISDTEQVRFEWMYAKSLFSNHQGSQAIKEIKSALQSPALSEPIPFLERLAFYSLTEGLYSEAQETYLKVLKTNQISESRSLAKIYLSLGYCFFKLKNETQAQIYFGKSLDQVALSPPQTRSHDRLIDFDPNRLKLILYGLLAQIGQPSSRLIYLEKRIELLQSSEKLLDQWLSTKIQSYLQAAYLAELIGSADHLKLARNYLERALQDAQKLADTHQLLGNVLYQALLDNLIYRTRHPELYSTNASPRLTQLVTQTLAAYSEVPEGPTQKLILDQQTKLKFYWEKQK